MNMFLDRVFVMKLPKIVLLAAYARNRAIGRNNTLPWSIRSEMAHFRRVTMGHTVLMGRHTAESIGSALKGRKNLVLTHRDTAPYSGQRAVRSLQDALKQTEGDTLIVIGGEQLYRQCLPLADELIITYVAMDVPDADAFFPEIDETFEQLSAEPHLSDSDEPDYAIWRFQRRVPMSNAA